MDCDESVVIMSAVSYMLGRSSYGVDCVCDYVIRKKNELTKSNKEVIVRDIKEYFIKWPEASHKSEWFGIIKILTEIL